jgi:hypothetical protein
MLEEYTAPVSPLDEVQRCVGFDWDEGNEGKSWERHRVSDAECEDVFFNDPLVLGADAEHSAGDRRYFGLGCTASRRLLFVAFAIRGNRIRIISARDKSERERRRYTR